MPRFHVLLLLLLCSLTHAQVIQYYFQLSKRNVCRSSTSLDSITITLWMSLESVLAKKGLEDFNLRIYPTDTTTFGTFLTSNSLDQLKDVNSTFRSLDLYNGTILRLFHDARNETIGLNDFLDHMYMNPTLPVETCSKKLEIQQEELNNATLFEFHDEMCLRTLRSNQDVWWVKKSKLEWTIPRSCDAARLYFQAAIDAGPWNYNVRKGYDLFLEGRYHASLGQYIRALVPAGEIAQNNAAFVLDRKLGKEVESLKLYEMALEDNVDAELRLGEFALKGLGRQGHADFDLAANLFLRASKKGSAQASFRLGELYEKGFGVIRSEKEAQLRYEEALTQLDHPESPESRMMTPTAILGMRVAIRMNLFRLRMAVSSLFMVLLLVVVVVVLIITSLIFYLFSSGGSSSAGVGDLEVRRLRREVVRLRSLIHDGSDYRQQRGE